MAKKEIGGNRILGRLVILVGCQESCLHFKITMHFVSCFVCIGGFAKVKAGVHKLTGEKVAIKIMDKHLLGVSYYGLLMNHNFFLHKKQES